MYICKLTIVYIVISGCVAFVLCKLKGWSLQHAASGKERPLTVSMDSHICALNLNPALCQV